jgi:hypothetical protein
MLQAAGRALRSALAEPAAALALPATRAVRRMGGASHDDLDVEHEPSYDATPTVFDRLITLNVVDVRGRRHTVRGLVGQTLNKTLIEAGFPAVCRGLDLPIRTSNPVISCN